MVDILLKLISFISLGLIIYDFGFDKTIVANSFINVSYFTLLSIYLIFDAFKTFKNISELKFKSIAKIVFHLLAILIACFYSFQHNVSIVLAVENYLYFYVLTFLVIFFLEVNNILSSIYTLKFSPAIIFAGSFFILIMIGSLLLMLPNSTTKGSIGIVDAIFTCTSSVCVTGLVVLDTGKDFTLMGQTIIIILIQLGGLGMLTLTSFFAYFFKGASSYQENLYLRDFLSSDQIGGLLGFALKIVLLTLFIELIGAILIFINIPNGYYNSLFEKIYFSVFHSVSAFCNAGFSTLTNNFYNENFRFSYNIHLILSFLIIFGGLGYAVTFNLFNYLKLKIKSLYFKYILKIENYHKSLNVLTLNSKIVVFTTLFLLIISTVAFMFTEFHNTLEEHTSFYGKLVTSFFDTTVLRTAGFNSVDLSALTVPTVLFSLILMWIGASPASTGGGIKTSTFALAVMNIYSTVTGKHRIEIGTREIPQDTVNRAFTIIMLSLFVLIISVTIIAMIEPNIDILAITFECFSAYATVGSSLGITGTLSDSSKVVLIIVMFIGRVGTINLLIGMLKQVQDLPYKYPKESILIN